MSIAARVGRAAVAAGLALPAAAQAQYSGVSHPDQSVIVDTEVSIPIQTMPPPTTLKPRPGVPYQSAPASTPSPTFKVIGPAVATTPADEIGPAALTPETLRDGRRDRDIDAGIVTEIPGPANVLPIGSMLKVRLAEDISTVLTANGTLFTAQLTEPVMRHGRVLLPAGSTLAGVITEVHGGKRVSGAASVHLRTTTVTLPDGMQYQVRAQVIDTGLTKQLKVDREGTILRKDHAGKTVATMALPIGAGAAAGAIVAGPPGALVGAGVGAGVSTVVWLKQDRQMEIPGKTGIVFSLIAPLKVGGE